MNNAAALAKGWVEGEEEEMSNRQRRGGGKVPPLSSGSFLVAFSLAFFFFVTAPSSPRAFFPFSSYDFPPTLVSFTLRRDGQSRLRRSTLFSPLAYSSCNLKRDDKRREEEDKTSTEK